MATTAHTAGGLHKQARGAAQASQRCTTPPGKLDLIIELPHSASQGAGAATLCATASCAVAAVLLLSTVTRRDSGSAAAPCSRSPLPQTPAPATALATATAAATATPCSHTGAQLPPAATQGLPTGVNWCRGSGRPGRQALMVSWLKSCVSAEACRPKMPRPSDSRRALRAAAGQEIVWWRQQQQSVPRAVTAPEKCLTCPKLYHYDNQTKKQSARA